MQIRTFQKKKFLRHDVIEQRFVFTFRKIISDRKKRFDTSFKI